MVTRRSLLEEARGVLKTPEARLDGEVLLRHLLKEGRAELYRDLDKAVPAFVPAHFRELLGQRAVGVPLQYLTGVREFYGLDFKVNRAVLIPRPETEILVERSLDLVKGRGQMLVADLGTGSGAIAVALATHLPDAQVLAVDISAAALQVAWANARTHRVVERVRFFCGDLLTPLAAAHYQGRLGLIVSNPPYIPQGDLEGLDPGVRDHEPTLALVGGADGLDVYRRLAQEVPAFLRPGGWLALEVGAGQAKAVAGLLAHQGVFYPAAMVSDLAGILRVVVAQKREE